jgi:ubiquinone/menaquinone biosynthesis C-methylase UbiE
MRRFLRRTSLEREPLAVTMAGVRMGERVLQIGLGDVRLTARLAAKPGMSGHSALVVSDERTAEQARSAVADAGALVDLHVTPPHTLPFDDRSFDAVIVHGTADALAPLDAAARTQVMRECHRVLRSGGRIVTLEAGTPTGLAALIRRSSSADTPADATGGTTAALQAAGFRPVRLLADRDGYRFYEGIKSAGSQ